MFRRKLTALEYHNPTGFDCKDETEFRNFIVWLEDQKIRHYKIEDRGNLRNIPSSDWPKYFEKYLQDVNCPFSVQERQETVDWLLGLAVRFEYGDNVEKYRNCKPVTETNDVQKSADPLINLDSEFFPPPNIFPDSSPVVMRPRRLIKETSMIAQSGFLSMSEATDYTPTSLHISPQPTMSGLKRITDPQLEEPSRCQLNNDTQGGQGSVCGNIGLGC